MNKNCSIKTKISTIEFVVFFVKIRLHKEIKKEVNKMFAEILAAIENFLGGLIDPVTSGIVSKVFDFLIEIYNMFAA